MTGSRMFPFITKTCNPLGGRCLHDCIFCWAQGPTGLVQIHGMEKYQGPARLIEKELKRKFRSDDFVFVSDMCDLFGNWVGRDFQVAIIERMQELCPTQFLLLTKNPEGYLDFINWGGYFSPNIVLGVTIESDITHEGLSKAPSQFQRMFWFSGLSKLMKEREEWHKAKNRLFVSIEPILDFNLEEFSNILVNWWHPWAVAMGYDNYGHNLPEPPLAKTMQLLDRLQKAGITVYRKTLREAWNERK